MASLIARFCRFLLIVLFLHEIYQSFCELPNVMMVHPYTTPNANAVSNNKSTITTNGSKYKSKFNNNNGSIDTNKHQIVDFNKNAKRQYTLNTDYISVDEDAFNAHIQELLLSEHVWIDDDELNIISVPVNVVTSSVQYKTSLNDRLVSYTIVFEQAFDLISTGR